MNQIILILLAILLTFKSQGQEIQFLNYDGFLSVGTQENRTASITLFDIDGDEDLDALVANGRHWAEQNYIYYNNGKGAFKTGQAIGALFDASYSINSGDFNRDGFMDIVIANDGTANKLHFGSSEGSFSLSTTY